MVEHGQWSGMDNGRAWTMVGHGQHCILSNTASAPGSRPNTVQTGQTLSEPAKTFTNESGMVNLPCDHSLIHVEQLFRKLCSPPSWLPADLAITLTRKV